MVHDHREAVRVCFERQSRAHVGSSVLADKPLRRVTFELCLKPGIWQMLAVFSLQRSCLLTTSKFICATELLLCLVPFLVTQFSLFWPKLIERCTSTLLSGPFVAATDIRQSGSCPWETGVMVRNTCSSASTITSNYPERYAGHHFCLNTSSRNRLYEEYISYLHPPPAAPPLMQCLTKSICCHWWLSSSVCCSALHHIALNVLYITTWRYNNHYLSAAALNWTVPVAWFKSCLHFLPISLHLRSVSCRSGVNLSNHWQKKRIITSNIPWNAELCC